MGETEGFCWVCGERVSLGARVCPSCAAPQDAPTKSIARRFFLREIENLQKQGLISLDAIRYLIQRYTSPAPPAVAAPPPAPEPAPPPPPEPKPRKSVPLTPAFAPPPSAIPRVQDESGMRPAPLAEPVELGNLEPPSEPSPLETPPPSFRLPEISEIFSERNIKILLYLGVFILFVSVLLFIRARWDAIPAIAKMAMVLSLTFVSGGAGVMLATGKNLRRTGVAFLLLSLSTISLDAYAAQTFGYITPADPLQLWIGAVAATLAASLAIGWALGERIFSHLAGCLATFLLFLVLRERRVETAWFPLAFSLYSLAGAGGEILLSARAGRTKPSLRESPPLLQSLFSIVLALGGGFFLQVAGRMSPYEAAWAYFSAAAALEVLALAYGSCGPIEVEGAVLLGGLLSLFRYLDLPSDFAGLGLALAAWCLAGVSYAERRAGGEEALRLRRVRARAISSATLAVTGLWLASTHLFAPPSLFVSLAFLALGLLTLLPASRLASAALGTISFLLLGVGVHIFGGWLGALPLWRPAARLAFALLMIYATKPGLSAHLELPWLRRSLALSSRLFALSVGFTIFANLPAYLALTGNLPAAVLFLLLGAFLLLDGRIGRGQWRTAGGICALALALPFLLSRAGVGADWIAPAWILFGLAVRGIGKGSGPNAASTPITHAYSWTGLAWMGVGLYAALVDAPAALAQRRFLPLEISLGACLLEAGLAGRKRTAWGLAAVALGTLLEVVLLRHGHVGWRYHPAFLAATATALLYYPADVKSLRIGGRALAIVSLCAIVPFFPFLVALRSYPPLELLFFFLAVFASAPAAFRDKRTGTVAAATMALSLLVVSSLHANIWGRHIPLLLAVAGATLMLLEEILRDPERRAGLADAAYGTAALSALAAFTVGVCGDWPDVARTSQAALLVAAAGMCAVSIRQATRTAGVFAAGAILAAYFLVLREYRIPDEAVPLAGLGAALFFRLASRGLSRFNALAAAWDGIASVLGILFLAVILLAFPDLYDDRPDLGTFAALAGLADGLLAAWPTLRTRSLARGLFHATLFATLAARWAGVPGEAQGIVHAVCALAAAAAFLARREGLPQVLSTWGRCEAILAFLLALFARLDHGGVPPVVAYALLSLYWLLDERLRREPLAAFLSLLHLILAAYAGLAEGGVAPLDRAVAGSLLGAALSVLAIPARLDPRARRAGLSRWWPSLLFFGLVLTMGEAGHGILSGHSGRATILSAIAALCCFLLAHDKMNLPDLAVAALALVAAGFFEASVAEFSWWMNLRDPWLGLGLLAGAPILLAASHYERGRENIAAAEPIFAVSLVIPLGAGLAATSSRTALALVSLGAGMHYAAASALLATDLLLYPALLSVALSYFLFLREMGVPMIQMPPYLLTYASVKVLLSGKKKLSHPLSLTAAVLPALVLGSMLAGGGSYLGQEVDIAILSTLIASLAYFLAGFLKDERRFHALGAGCLLSSYYLFLHRQGVEAWEFYTVPPAAAVLALAARLFSRGSPWSSATLGSGLFLLLVPSLFRSFVAENIGSAGFLCLASVAVLAAGIRLEHRRMATAGATALVADVVIQGVRYIEFGAVPKAVWGIVLGTLLIGAGLYFERRLQKEGWK